MEVRAVSSSRGSFVQGTRLTLFLRVANLSGEAVDATSISFSIIDSSSTVVHSGIPERAAVGFYALDWDIPEGQAVGDYIAEWKYVADANAEETYDQPFVVNTKNDTNPPSLYAGRILEFRQSLEMMIRQAQCVPVYREQALPSSDNQNFQFTFERWNPGSRCKIFLNNEIVTSGITVDYFKGRVSFDNPLTEYDTVMASYNFRWFAEEELDRFLSNAMHLVNLWPPVSMRISFMNLTDRLIPLVLYGAAVDAIRNMMMSLMFQEPQMVFGGPEGAAKIYAQLEGLKKNYEETWNKGIEQKKNGPYVGLTRTMVTPEFALPGGRSRWFRYLFSNGA